MKKLSGILILVFGLMFTANAQSDNASALAVRGEGNGTSLLIQYSTPWGVFLGPSTIVITPSGNATLSWTGYLVVEGNEVLKRPFKATFNDFDLYFVWDELRCQISPGLVANCIGKTSKK